MKYTVKCRRSDDSGEHIIIHSSTVERVATMTILPDPIGEIIVKKIIDILIPKL